MCFISMRVQIQRFDPTKMKKHRTILMIGKRGTGKSTLLKDIMFHLHKNVDFGIAMTPTEESCEMFRCHMPEAWIYNSFNAGKLDQMLQMQRQLGKKNKQRDLYVVMDDCAYDKKVLKGVGIRDLFMNGRHLHVTLMYAMQYIMDMGPDLRSQCDYIFALRESIISNKQRLWRYFFGMFDKYEDFSRVLDRCTENHCCLVLDNTAKTSRLEDTIFWYRADLNHPNFPMGKPVFINMARKAAKTEGEIEHEEEQRLLLLRQAEREKKKSARITTIERKDEKGRVIVEEGGVELLVSG